MSKDLTKDVARRPDEPPPSIDQLLRQNDELRHRLSEAEEALHAIRGGEIDAVLVEADREQVYTLEIAEKPYRLLVERMPHAAATLTVDGSIIACNRRFVEMLGRTVEALSGRSIQSFVPQSSRAGIEALVRDGRLGEVHGEIELIRGD